MDKKTVTVSAKVSEETHQAMLKALGRTGTGKTARFLQGCIDDLVAKYQAGVRIEEPIRLMSQTERRQLDSILGKDGSRHRA